MKMIAVMRREFVERVRTKTFIIATLIGPLFFAALAIIPGLLLGRGSTDQRVAVVDGTASGLGARVVSALESARTSGGDERLYRPTLVNGSGRLADVVDSVVKHIGQEEGSGAALSGLLIIDDGVLSSGRMRYYGRNVGSIADMQRLEGMLSPVVVRERLQNAGIDPQLALSVARPLELETRKVAGGRLTAESGGSTFGLAYVMGILLYLALSIYGVQVMTSVIEEKSSRVVEILISSVRPFEMMVGKVVGVGLVCLLQLGIWCGAFLLLREYQGVILGWFGIGSQSGASPFAALPGIGTGLITVFLVFFILGFLFYSAGYAAIGAMCNTVQEAQQLQAPLMVSGLVGWFSAIAILKDHSSEFARIASFIPPLAPFVVPVRYSIAPLPVVTVFGYFVVAVLGVIGMMWVTGRVYRVGLLMYGRRATFRDVARWIRAR